MHAQLQHLLEVVRRSTNEDSILMLDKLVAELE